MTEQTTSLGVFDFDNEAETASLINKLKRRSGRLEVVLRLWRARRSNAQNRYYWGVIVERVREKFSAVFANADEAHSFLSALFLKVEKVDTETGEVFTFFRSTTKLNTKEFSDYCEEIRRWAAIEYGLNIPEPNEPIFEDEPLTTPQ